MGRFAVFVDAGYFWVQTISAVLGTPHGVRADVSIDFPKLRSDLLSQVCAICWGTNLLKPGPATAIRSLDRVSCFSSFGCVKGIWTRGIGRKNSER
jgi:hypothetical protein